MKRLSKFLLTAAVSLSLVTTALANEAYFGKPKAGNPNDARAGYVLLINDTPGTYPIQAIFRPSGTVWPVMYIGPAGSPTGMITYDINSARDVGVDISVDGGRSYTPANGAFPYNALHIRYGASANNLPVIGK